MNMDKLGSFLMKSSGLEQLWITHSLIQIKYESQECQFIITLLMIIRNLVLLTKRCPFSSIIMELQYILIQEFQTNLILWNSLTLS